jgi:hypothetical protein
VPYRVVVRSGPRVERRLAADLAGALALVERYGRGLAAQPRPRAVDLRYRRFEPGEQVAHRVELAGPGRLRPAVRAGIDVRGDGSVEAWTGRLRRAGVERAPDESPYDALRRALGA